MRGNGNENIPVLILAGGMGTRLSEETQLRPKPMVEIGGVPILVHLMRWYYSYGFNDFVICAGYRSWEIKKYFLTYEYRVNHMVIDHRASHDERATSLGKNMAQEKWRVRVLDTGLDAMTGSRVARALDEIGRTDSFTEFALTYGDGLSDVDLDRELAFHRSHGKTGTALGVRPVSRFGELDVAADGRVTSFLEKPRTRQSLISGGFFFFKRSFRDFLSDEDACVLEKTPLARLTEGAQLMVHEHKDFWYAMDTLRDKTHLEELWNSGRAPWVRR